jgi:hypothetical protein
LKAVKQIDHSRREIGVVVDHLPRSILTPVDVGDAVIERDSLASQRYLALFDSNFVGQIRPDQDDLVA